METNHHTAKHYDISRRQNHLARVPERHRPDVDDFVAFKRSQGLKNGTPKNHALRLQTWCSLLEKPLGKVTKQDMVASVGDLRNRRCKLPTIAQAAVLVKAPQMWQGDEAKPKSLWMSPPTHAT